MADPVSFFSFLLSSFLQVAVSRKYFVFSIYFFSAKVVSMQNKSLGFIQYQEK